MSAPLLSALLLLGASTQPSAAVDAPVPATDSIGGPDGPTETAVPPLADMPIDGPGGVRPPHGKGDPLEGFNRRMFSIQQGLDKAVLRPAAMGYKHVVPKPARDGARNFFSNLREPIVFLNYMLQLKPGKAAETFGRFAINTLMGVGGLFDVAKTPAVKLPHRPNGLGNTLAFYGVKSGPYLFLPLFGPSTLRDLAGGQVDGLVLPVAVGAAFDKLEYQIPKAVVTGLDARAEADADLQALFETALDPYATLRSVYLQSRAGEIEQLHGHHGDVPASGLDEPLDDPAAASPAPATGSQPATPDLSDPLADPAAQPPATPI